MSSSGMLRPNEVVFYHPLDDFVEHTLSQTWVGSAGFTTGKVGDGTSAATSDAFSIFPEQSASNNNINPRVTIGLGSGHALLLGKTAAYIGTVSGNYVAIGPIHVGMGGTVDNLRNKGVPLYYDESSGDGQTVLFHRSYGTTILHTIDDNSVVSRDIDYIGHAAGIQPTWGGFVAKLDESHFIVAAQDIGGNTYSRVGTVAGTAFSYGDKQNFTGDASGSIPDSAAALSPSSVLMYFDKESGSGSGYAMVATVNGTGVTYGDPVLVTNNQWNHTGPNTANTSDAVALDDSRVVIAWPTTEGKGSGIIATVSGTTITLGEPTLFEPIGSQDGTMFKISLTSPSGDANHVFLSYYHRETGLDKQVGTWARVGTASGTSLSFGEKALVTSALGDNAALTSDTCAFSYHTVSQSMATKLGVLDKEASISGTMAYPSGAGNDRIVSAFWSRNPSLLDTNIEVQRDYLIDVDSASIGLGPNGAVWSGAGISTLMSQLNDSEDHFLVLDFEHSESGNWTLNTSADGSGWVSQGTQSSGSRDTSPSGTASTLSIHDGESQQWIDELVLWAGDKTTFTQFTEAELGKLHSLGDIFDRTMDQYDSTWFFDSDSCDLYIDGYGVGTDSCDLVIFGPLPATSGADLFLKTIEPCSGTCNLFIQGVASTELYGKQFDWLYRYHDHHPQLIGAFTGASSATIQVWEVTNGQNTPIELANSGCYAIGDTGRWGWSTEYLPRPQGYARHYYYLMTSDNNYAFDGQFIFDIPEEARWIHPSSQEDYLV